MKNIHHPSEILSADATTLIREEAAGAEKLGALTPRLLELIYAQKWFTLLAPQAYNSLEISLPELVKLEEAISWADGSTGWVVTLCAGASWFGGFLSPSVAATIFSDSSACLAGSGATSGTAERTSDGYIVNGKWLHATGSPHATVFTANCIITENNIPVRVEDGSELVRPLIFFRDEVSLTPTWKSFGLVATASNAFEISAVTVPSARAFSLKPGHAVIDAPLYKYPFYQLAEVTLASNISGMAIHFLDEATAILERKKGAFGLVALPILKKAIADLNVMRSTFYLALDDSWQELLQNGMISTDSLLSVTNASRALAKLAVSSVDTIYPYCGLIAASTETMINQVWRDIHTASQHTLLTYPLV